MVVWSPNPEWSDLPFAWPRSYGVSREGRGWGQPLPRLLVVHHTAGSENAQSAENGAAYDQIRTDGTSAHYYVDPDSIVQCVPTWMRSNTAHRNGNTLGVHYELCGTLQTRAQWLDANSRPIVALAAKQMARDAAKWNIPIRQLTTEQVRAGQSGICGHVNITNAWPDHGTHTDPGPHFPWDVLLSDIQATGGTMTSPDLVQESDPSYGDLIYRVLALVSMTDPAGPSKGINELAKTLKQLAADVATLKAAAADPLPVVLSDEDLNTLKTAILAQLPSMIPTPQEYAEAVAKRLDKMILRTSFE